MEKEITTLHRTNEIKSLLASFVKLKKKKGNLKNKKGRNNDQLLKK